MVELASESAGSVTLVQYAPPDFEAMRKALLAEARAWRRVARIAFSLPLNIDTWTSNEAISVPFRGKPFWEQMENRQQRHHEPCLTSNSPTERRNVAILRALFLEIECREEASSLPAAPKKKQVRNG